MSFRIKKASKVIFISFINVIFVLAFYNLGLFLGEIFQKV